MARATRHTRHAVQNTNKPSSEQENSAAEEGEEEEFAHSSHGATDMTSSDASDESYKIPSHMADPDSSSQSDSEPPTPSGRPQVNQKINRKQAKQMLHHSINRPAKSKSQTPFTLNFYLQLPRPSMIDIFSQDQLQKLGLTALATTELPTDVPGNMIHELLSRFPKVRGHNLTPERIGHALGMTTFPSVKPATRTYSKISKDATVQACQDLLHSDHPDYARNMELWKVFKYYFLLRDASENTKSLPTIFSHCEGLYCLIHTMPCGFHQILYTSLQSRAKRFRTQIQSVQSSFQCFAAPMLAWVISIHISPMDVDADTPTPQSIARGKGKTKDASTSLLEVKKKKRAKVMKDTTESLMTLPVSQSHLTRVKHPIHRPTLTTPTCSGTCSEALDHTVYISAGPSTVCVPLSTAAIFTHSVVTPSTTPLGVVSSPIAVSVAPLADTIPVSTSPERLVSDPTPAVSQCPTCSSTPAVPAVSPRRTEHLPSATDGASFTYTDSTSLFRLSEENLRKSREALATIEQGAEQLAALHQSHSATYAAMEGALRIAESAIADRDASLFAMRHDLRDQSRVIADLRVQNQGPREALLHSQMGFQPPGSSGYGGYGGIGQGIQIQTPIG
ncbi:hypothetical protein L7F22_069059, partial [Adiantum nelumboides]|nr:hypothetical protein [Adiantum nelumboides]